VFAAISLLTFRWFERHAGKCRLAWPSDRRGEPVPGGAKTGREELSDD
jgi:hypothetical protein